MSPSRSFSRRSVLFAAGALALVPVLSLTACSDSDKDGDADRRDSGPTVADTVTDLPTTVVVTDPDGLATCVTLFAAARAVIVVDGDAPDAVDQMTAACTTATEHGVPVLQSTTLSRDAVDAEITRLGADHVLAPGDPWPDGLDAGRPGDLTGVALVSPTSGPAAAAVATAAGLTPVTVTAADPRSTDASIDAVVRATADGQPVVGLGDDFGTVDDLTRRADLAGKVTDRLPGGGGVLFPGRRMVALYGHPSGPALGCLGEQDPAASVTRTQDLAAQYTPLSDVPVVPTFEIIATVASDQPGDAGTYAIRTDPEELRPLVDAITAAGGYAVLDLQPGRELLLDQAKVYEDLLRNPQVGLALDPEWKLGPDALPMEDVGQVTAAEINDVTAWLDALVADNNLPQKLLMVHQFQVRMIIDRETMVPGTDHVCVAIHCDGHGSTGMKLETWDAVRDGLDPRIALGWKNFIDEDTPMLTPDQTVAVEPSPSIVTYQ